MERLDTALKTGVASVGGLTSFCLEAGQCYYKYYSYWLSWITQPA